MAQTYRSRFLGVLAANERRMTELFTGLATGIIGEVTKRADADGLIPRSAVPDMLDAVNSRVTTFFVGRGSNGTRAPFETLPDGSVWPLSPYMRALWQAITDATRLPVAQAAQEMTKRLPADILTVMRQANGDPFAAAKAQVREQVFRPNPLARYEAPHTWVDPNGYTLSERIWNMAGDTRRRLDAMLEDGIARGRGVLNLQNRGATGLARDLEQFLIPGRQLLTTKKPYGIDASFDAMRLARTEITRAHGEATKVSAAMNPFVQEIKWNLSRSHSKLDICDDNANGGENGDGVYPIDAVPQYPAHPQDRCFLTQVVIPAAERDAMLDELRADVRRERAELVRLVGPVEVERFTQRLLGQEIQTVRAVPVIPQPAVPLVPSTIFMPPVATRPQWSPNMNRVEAEAWAANSKYSTDLYHGTANIESAQSIRDNGFSLTSTRGGRVFGDGVYMTPEVDQANFWASYNQRQPGEVLSVKIDVSNPLIVNRDEFGKELDALLAREFPRGKPRGTYEEFMLAMAKTKTEYVTGRGYDALILRAPRDELFATNFDEWLKRYGGDQAIVFDPRKIVVIND